jgi:Leucine-rich repeat (LRR) protein
LGVIVLATYLCHGAALEAAAGIEPEIRGRRQLLKLVAAWVITLLGPTGILILGVILGALILFWMCSRMLTPPVITSLVPAKTPQPVKSKAEPAAAPNLPISPLPQTPKQASITAPALKPAPLPPPTRSPSPAPPQIRLSWATVVRFIAITLVALALSLIALVGILYWNLPPSFPGLIEAGTALDLSGRNLTSADLEGLSLDEAPQENLVTVDLSRNQLTTLPAEIGSLRNIKFLYIKENQLTTLPPEIGQLSNLTTLHLGSNQLTTLPPEIGQLTKLEELYLTDNQLKTLPPEIGRLPNLKTLNVQFNYNIHLPPEIEHKPDLYIYR